MSEGFDEWICKRMNRRYRELAGMLKEIGKGTIDVLECVLARFAMQEGIRKKTTEMYLDTLVTSKLIIIREGSEDWCYNEDAEWNLFKINI